MASHRPDQCSQHRLKLKNSAEFSGQFLRNFTSWWFQIFLIFIPIWGTFPFWLIFFNWVGSTTNQFRNFRGLDGFFCIDDGRLGPGCPELQVPPPAQQAPAAMIGLMQHGSLISGGGFLLFGWGWWWIGCGK